MVYSQTGLELRYTKEFERWIRRLKDTQGRARILSRLRRIELSGSLGDFKDLGDGIGEIRLGIGPGYRLYWSKRGSFLLLLLVGGDKSTQRRDIARAQRLNRLYEWDGSIL